MTAAVQIEVTSSDPNPAVGIDRPFRLGLPDHPLRGIAACIFRCRSLFTIMS